MLAKNGLDNGVHFNKIAPKGAILLYGYRKYAAQSYFRMTKPRVFILRSYFVTVPFCRVATIRTGHP